LRPGIVVEISTPDFPTTLFLVADEETAVRVGTKLRGRVWTLDEVAALRLVPADDRRRIIGTKMAFQAAGPPTYTPLAGPTEPTEPDEEPYDPPPPDEDEGPTQDSLFPGVAPPGDSRISQGARSARARKS
jgi:hypothetical protein